MTDRQHSKKINCWEFMKCGREPGGKKTDKCDTCPASSDTSFNGINDGVNAGRFCWAVSGTYCGGEIRGSYEDKRRSCVTCPFFKKVQTEEGAGKMDTKFLRFVCHEDGTPLIEGMRYRRIPAGERFVHQGSEEGSAYIIQRGSCLAIVEKDDQFFPVNHYGEGDVVGGLGILTGEQRLSSVEAETDVEVWELDLEQFKDLSSKDPEVIEFLTEVVANRFDSQRPVAYRTIGKYVATDIVGRGGYSIVYKGIHSDLNMPVAIKMMRHDMALDEDFLMSFRSEAKSIATLNHDNIIQVYDIEERYRTVFIIMEFIEGITLKEMLKDLRRIPAPLTVDFLMQVCAGLDYAHHEGLIHRDIKPDNIFYPERRPAEDI